MAEPATTPAPLEEMLPPEGLARPADETIVEPLVLASAVYPRMEIMALEARERLQLFFRIFDPDTRLRSHEAGTKKLHSWGDLLAHRAADGVKVEVFVADFDPLFAPHLHAGAARTKRRLAEIATANGVHFDVVVRLHPGEVGAAMRTLLWPLVRLRVAKADPSRKRWWPPQRLYPATHHAKMMVADEKEMVIGGLDVDERRFDTPLHDQPAEKTWQDVSAFVAGPPAREASQFAAWQMGLAPAPERPDGTDKGRVRFLATASTPSPSPWAVGPIAVRQDLLREMLALIGSARQLLYIENQFVRDKEVVATIANQLDREPGLNVVVLTPAAPEEVAFKGDTGDGLRHGEYLQSKLLGDLLAKYRERVGVFTLAGARPPESEEVLPDRAVTKGRGIVYIHSKVLIADDAIATISSCNLNGRSLRMDTETGIVWRDAPRVADFRQALWSHHLREGADCSLEDALSVWRTAALENAKEQPGPFAPGGFVLTWHRRKAKRASIWRPYMPDRYV